MKKLLVGLMVAAAMVTFGCGGRNADFGTVDMAKVQAEAPIMKTLNEEMAKKATELRKEAEEAMAKAGDDQAAQQKAQEDYVAKSQLVQSEASAKLKSSLDAALNQVAQEKKLGAILVKQAVPQGGVDVTADVIAKMK